ncbi:Diacylglycerol kinase [Meloidogyne graminicola]|uniref:Diacylglycerol kinase n=1 Tax=Meloidogyne graminicola TaxID=189291 RepID=A0A8S9ZG10_9BILA|nr:Diacylglycerol kinase [Meloidogyne graminicola]
MRSIVTVCTGQMMQLIKNPVAHTWTDPQHIKRHFCYVCRKRTDDTLSSECEVCSCYVHVECQDSALADCREASTYVPSLDRTTSKQFHHMREGNLARDAKCVVCKKGCYSAECLSGFRCQWCNLSVHSTCYRQFRPQCDFGLLRKIMLPPNAVTTPRAELPMDLLLNIHTTTDDIQNNNEGRKASSPSRHPGTDEKDEREAREDRDSDDQLLLRIFDGNSSLRNKISKTAYVPKTASCDQIRDIAMRRFHICDSNRENYYITQAPHEPGDEEEPLEDPIPLRNVKKPEGKCAQVFLRYRDDDPDKAIVRIHGGWLRIPCEYTDIVVTGRMCVQECIQEALENFGLDGTTWNRYNLQEVSLEKGVAERTINPQEEMLQLVRNLKKDSLRRSHVVRFYIQEKEDPHDHAVFVSNLPPSRSQRQYERILLKLLSVNERPFCAIGPIYFEYGSLVITFNTPKAASAAVLRLQNAIYEDKKLVVLCLPNVQSHMIPPDVEPLLKNSRDVWSSGLGGRLRSLRVLVRACILVLVNVKSGGCQGTELISAFRRLLNPFQVFDVLKGGPLVGLYVFRNIPKYRILAAGGDGTVGWVLQCLDIAKQDAACFSPPCAVLPLGTGNDLARVLRWGGGWGGEESAVDILRDVIEAEEVRLDRWAVVFHEEELPSTAALTAKAQTEDAPMTNPEDQTSMIIMNNYFGIGVDADVLFNKTQYVKIGLQKAFDRTCKDLWKRVELEVDGRPIELPPCEGIIVLNVLSWGSGANPWGTAKEEAPFQKPTHYDGLLETLDNRSKLNKFINNLLWPSYVVGITDVSRLGLIQSKLAAGTRIAQGGSIKIITKEMWPVQVDGEPHIQPPGTITILKSALKAKMLKKNKKSRKNVAATVRAVQSEGSPSNDFEHPNSSHLEVELRTGHGKSTPEEINSFDDDEEADSFL